MNSENMASPLQVILTAMERAQILSQSAADEHLRAFAFQMREIAGAEKIALDEPYFDAVLAQANLRYVQKLEKLADLLEDGEEKASAQYGWDTKSIDLDEPLLPQIKDRLAIEQVRHERRLKQTLDSHRQQAFGITQYIWHTAGDDRVRSSHAVNEGKMFSWDNPPPTGHPGKDYNCRCSAEPVLAGAGEPRFNPDDEVQVASIVPLITFIMQRLAARRLAAEAARRAALAAARRAASEAAEEVGTTPIKPGESPKEILNPDGKPIGIQGNRIDVRIIKGGENGAKKLFDKLSKGGKPEQRGNYSGKGVSLPNDNWIGYRPKSKSGPPTIDLDIKDFPYTKIKFID